MENEPTQPTSEPPPPNAAPTTTTAASTSTAPPPPPPPQPQPQPQPQQPPPPPQETVTPRRRGGGVKRKSNTSNSSSTKRRGRASTPLPHIHHSHNGPITRARQSPNKAAAAAADAAYYSSSAAAGFSGGVHDNPTRPKTHPTARGSAIGEAATASLEMSSAEYDQMARLEPVIDAEFEAIRSRDPNVHVVPTPAAWFSWTKIHRIEERALPSFFNGKSETRSPEIYMEIRNSIMKRFHKDPKTQIEIKDLSELSAGELDARKDVMEFLDYWGLINFHPFPVVDTSAAETTVDGSSRTASLLENLYKFEVGTPLPRGHKADSSTQAIPHRLLPEASTVDEVRPEGPSVEYHCNSCSADCSRKRYHCQKQADFDLCSECYNNGKFDSGMSPADFILMEPAEVPGTSGGSWTDQETLLLLEALELFGDNWSEIAEHVATKSKAQCILHFVQMPIEDSFLDGKDDYDANLKVKEGPGPTYDASDAMEVPNEKLENESATNTDLTTLKESHETKESNDPNNASSTLDKTVDATESHGLAEKKPPNVNALDLSDSSQAKVEQENSANLVINALKEAFQAVGSGESISFADAGNPVMALAAFLSGLVVPDIAAASSRSSLKSTSSADPGIHLASRHCYILEDPSDDLKEPPAPESADVEMVDSEAQKEDHKVPKDEIQKEQVQVKNDFIEEAKNDKDRKEEGVQVNNMTVLDGTDASKDGSNKETDLGSHPEGKENCETKEHDDLKEPPAIESADVEMVDTEAQKEDDKVSKDQIQKEQVQVKNDFLEEAENDKDRKEEGVENNMAVMDGGDVSKDGSNKEADLGSHPEGKENCETKEHDDTANREDAAPGIKNKLNDAPVPGPDQTSPQDVAKERLDAKEPDGVTTNRGVESSTVVMEDSALPKVDLSNTVNRSNDLAIPSETLPVSIMEATHVAPPTETSHVEVPKNVDVDSSSVPYEDKGPQDTVYPNSTTETGANAGECRIKEVECRSEKISKSLETGDDHNIEKVKRAALTVFSAAAVKSKLLADQEEDQIRQLATFLIEKQLHKIETKLAFFADMENVIIRAKDQLDKSRQKLYNERAQIIAARMGTPPSSSRTMPPSATNRVAMNYANLGPKPLPNMNSQNVTHTSH